MLSDQGKTRGTDHIRNSSDDCVMLESKYLVETRAGQGYVATFFFDVQILVIFLSHNQKIEIFKMTIY